MDWQMFVSTLRANTKEIAVASFYKISPFFFRRKKHLEVAICNNYDDDMRIIFFNTAEYGFLQSI
jgi:hypothetical protein